MLLQHSHDPHCGDLAEVRGISIVLLQLFNMPRILLPGMLSSQRSMEYKVGRVSMYAIFLLIYIFLEGGH